MSETKQQAPSYSLHPRAAHRSVAGEVFVVSEDRGFHRLHGATSVALFGALRDSLDSTGVTVEELTSLLTAQFEVDVETAHADVVMFLNRLESKGIAVSRDPAPTPPRDAFPGLPTSNEVSP